MKKPMYLTVVKLGNEFKIKRVDGGRVLHSQKSWGAAQDAVEALFRLAPCHEGHHIMIGGG